MSRTIECKKPHDKGTAENFFCDGHEARFLIGSILISKFSSPKKIIGFPAKIPTLWILVKAAKKGSLSLDDQRSKHLKSALLQEHLVHFDPTFRDNSVRYQLGDVLTDGLSSIRGIVRMPHKLFLIARRNYNTPTGSRDLTDTVISYEDSNPDEDFEEPLELYDEIETEPGLIGAANHKESASTPGTLIDAIETEPGLGLDRHSLRADRLWLESVIETLGSRNTGVGIQNYANQIVATISDKHLLKCRAAFETRGNVAGLQLLSEKVEKDQLGTNINAYLARTLAVLQISEQGFALLPAGNSPAYEADKKKLLYAIHMRSPYISNGYVTRTYTVMNVLKELDYEPEGVTRLGFPNDLAKFRHEKIAKREEVSGHDFIALKDDKGGQLLRPIDNLVMAYADRLEALAKQHKPAVIHAASNYLNGLAAIVAARRLGISSIYEVRGIWEITLASHDQTYELTYKYRMQRVLENLAIQNADRVITISEPLKEFVIKQGADPKNVYVVPNGVDTGVFLPQDQDKTLADKIDLKKTDVVIGYVGSIVHYEGLDILLQAVAQLPDASLNKTRIIIVGDGAALPRLKALAQKLAIEDICIFTGRVERDDVRAWYSLIDIAPFPRRSLPVTELVPPLKPYEAMAMEKAVIVSSVRALACEISDGKTGFIFEKNNVGDLAEKLHALLQDKKLRDKLGRSGGNWVARERSIEALSRHMEKAYSSLDL